MKRTMSMMMNIERSYQQDSQEFQIDRIGDPRGALIFVWYFFIQSNLTLTLAHQEPPRQIYYQAPYFL